MAWVLRHISPMAMFTRTFGTTTTACPKRTLVSKRVPIEGRDKEGGYET